MDEFWDKLTHTYTSSDIKYWFFPELEEKIRYISVQGDELSRVYRKIRKELLKNAQIMKQFTKGWAVYPVSEGEESIYIENAEDTVTKEEFFYPNGYKIVVTFE